MVAFEMMSWTFRRLFFSFPQTLFPLQVEAKPFLSAPTKGRPTAFGDSVGFCVLGLCRLLWLGSSILFPSHLPVPPNSNLTPSGLEMIKKTS